jgi:cardiolipin synthase
MRLQAEIRYKMTQMLRKFFISFILLFSLNSFAQQTLIIEPDDGPAPLIDAIAHTQDNLDLVMYGFTDERFAHALIHAQQQGKHLRILLQEHPYKFDSENQEIISLLQGAHIPLVYPDQNFKLTHQKTLITDNKNAYVMTFNLTHSTFKNERNFALLITDPGMLAEIETVFSADWQHKSMTPHNPDLIWSPDNSREKLLGLIHSTQQEIKVYAENLTDYEIVGALAQAARKGVRVMVLTSNEGHKNISKQFEYLKKSGVEIRFSKGLIIHAKALLIDHHTAVIGSINMTRPSLNENRELAVITHEPQIINALEKTFSTDWNSTAPLTQLKVIPFSLQKTLTHIMRLAKLEQRHIHHALRKKPGYH